MHSRTSAVPARRTFPRPIVWWGSVVIVVLAGLGIWWAASAATSSAAPESALSALPDNTRMGAVELATDDLAPMRAFYVEAVGLEVLAEEADALSLGHDGEELLSIVRHDDRATDDPAQAGLYHSAILYPDEPSLAVVLRSIATVAPLSYTGSADHAVSLAFYFTDPDGNGVELYTDTPEEDWVWNDGLVQMGAAPLDPNAFIQEHLATTPTDAAVTMGHVHLRVGDLAQAREFYSEVLGFAVTAEAEGALFYAAGGYHHHVATNTWGSAGASDRPESLGLGSLTVRIGDESALLDVADRLTRAGADFTQEPGVLTVDDPWGNTVHLRS